MTDAPGVCHVAYTQGCGVTDLEMRKLHFILIC